MSRTIEDVVFLIDEKTEQMEAVRGCLNCVLDKIEWQGLACQLHTLEYELGQLRDELRRLSEVVKPPAKEKPQDDKEEDDEEDDDDDDDSDYVDEGGNEDDTDVTDEEDYTISLLTKIHGLEAELRKRPSMEEFTELKAKCVRLEAELAKK